MLFLGSVDLFVVLFSLIRIPYLLVLLGILSGVFHSVYRLENPQINKFFLTKWQQWWHNNKICQIKPSLGEWRPAFRKSRKKSHYISIADWPYKQGQPSQCLICQTPYTIKHVLVECGALAITREQQNMRDVWERPHRWYSLFLERYRVIPKNIILLTTLENSAIQLSTNKLLLNSNIWNH